MGIPLLNNRDLAKRLGINLARWKRWSREFLPPDPLAGKQSGYARQYYLDDAFRTYLGGHLVAHLNLPVCDARRILADLAPWMKREGLCYDIRGQRRSALEPAPPVLTREVRIQSFNGGFRYHERRLVARRCIAEGPPVLWEERWAEGSIQTGMESAPAAPNDSICRTLRISALLDDFEEQLGFSVPPEQPKKL